MASAHGFNVGVDAHIDPKPHATALYVEWNKVKLHFPIQRGADVTPPWRGDVGIAPYIHAGLHSIGWGALKPAEYVHEAAAHAIVVIYSEFPL